MKKKRKKKNEDTIAKVVYWFYCLSLIMGLLIVGKIIYLQCFFRPDPRIENELTQSVNKIITNPVRGSILAKDGRVLALSSPSYNIAMDPSVMKNEYADKKNGAELEQNWRDKARSMCDGLAKIFPEKSANQYYKMIISDRKAGKRYRAIGHPIDYSTLQKVQNLPLFKEGRFQGGLIVEQREVRQYPYGSLGRRAIGYVRDNGNGKSSRGIEGAFDDKLEGKAGYHFTKVKDGRQRVESFDSIAVNAIDGLDVRSTLDIDIQDLADRSLRAQIDENPKIEGGCAMVMDVHTGALRAMVNLKRDANTGTMEESYNYAIGRAGEPGSVFKSTILMSLLEDGYITTLDTEIPTNGGKEGYFPIDEHVVEYEQETGKRRISILKGLEVSSNYVFCHLAYEYYKDTPEKYINRIFKWNLGEAFDFDIKGLVNPTVHTPGGEAWDHMTLGSTAYGYTVTETPLHILTFYNAIANDGKMMKPYLVESVEKNRISRAKYGPKVLSQSICSKATADTLTRGLVNVVINGTGNRLRDAACQVAGKTGTAQVTLTAEDGEKLAGRYTDERGRTKNQATFVGFFPADNPKYSLIVVVYSILSGESFYGGTIPAQVSRNIVDGICGFDPYWRKTASAKAELPSMEAEETETVEGIMPDLTGLGLKDAIYLIERAGLKSSHSGMGHVQSQVPKAGESIRKGQRVSIALR